MRQWVTFPICTASFVAISFSSKLIENNGYYDIYFLWSANIYYITFTVVFIAKLY